mgnify:CR=1 FL=1
MKNALIAILLCGVAVAACERQAQEPKQAEDTTTLGWEGSETANDANVNIRADTETGEVELKLPGGIEGKVKLPAGLDADSTFDLDGIGRYPGATLTSVDIKATDRKDAHDARVVLGFSAPGTADTVADWYEQALVKDGRSVSRTGTTVTTVTDDGKPMVIAITDGAGGTARGRITITDRKG